MAISSKPPSGMRDFLPAELMRRNHVASTIKQVYELYGFVPVETPSIENLSTLLGKYGDEGDQLLFRILHRRDKLAKALAQESTAEKDLADLGLRYDLTVPLARLIANNSDLPKFFKRYQIQPVWRADRPGRGRFREFLQCDVDITGTQSLMAEAEVCGAVAEVFNRLGFNDFKIHLNHRQLLKQIIQHCGMDESLEGTTLTAVDKLDKIGIDGVKKELLERGITNDQIEKLIALISRPESISDTDELERLASELGAGNSDGCSTSHNFDTANHTIGELKELLSLLKNTPAEGKCFIDASLARGLGYYTGAIFEIRAEGLNGSIGGGGRYDGLIGMFRGRDIPAVGFSIGFERLVLLLEEKGLFADISAGPDVLLCSFADAPRETVLAAANQLRRSGIKVEIFPETPKLGKQLGYAETIGAKFAAIMGADEAKNKQLSIKNLKTGQQQTLDIDAAAVLMQQK